MRGDDGKLTNPCICVCPTIAQCIIAIGEINDLNLLHVYETVGNPIPQNDVFDFSVTQEHRFFEEKTFTKIGIIDISAMKLPRIELSGIPDDKILRNARIMLDIIQYHILSTFVDNDFHNHQIL